MKKIFLFLFLMFTAASGTMLLEKHKDRQVVIYDGTDETGGSTIWAFDSTTIKLYEDSLWIFNDVGDSTLITVDGSGNLVFMDQIAGDYTLTQLIAASTDSDWYSISVDTIYSKTSGNWYSADNLIMLMNSINLGTSASSSYLIYSDTLKENSSVFHITDELYENTSNAFTVTRGIFLDLENDGDASISTFGPTLYGVDVQVDAAQTGTGQTNIGINSAVSSNNDHGTAYAFRAVAQNRAIGDGGTIYGYFASFLNAEDYTDAWVFYGSGDYPSYLAGHLYLTSTSSVGGELLSLYEAGNDTTVYMWMSQQGAGTTLSDGVLFGILGNEQAVWNNQENTSTLIYTNNTQAVKIDSNQNVLVQGNITTSTGEITAANIYSSNSFYLATSSWQISKDMSNNMTFKDPITGTKTLAELAAGGGGTADSIFSSIVVDTIFANTGSIIILDNGTSYITFSDYFSNPVLTGNNNLVLNVATGQQIYMEINGTTELSIQSTGITVPNNVLVQDNLTVTDTLKIVSVSNEIYIDGSNNLVFKDSVTGSKTLAELAADSQGDSLFSSIVVDTIFTNLLYIYDGTNDISQKIQTAKANGTAYLIYQNDADSWYSGINGNDDFIVYNSGSGTTPFLIEDGAGNNAVKISSTNSVSIEAGDLLVTGGHIYTTQSAQRPVIVNEASTATNPIFSFYNDYDTGMGTAGADSISLIIAGSEIIAIGDKIKANSDLYIINSELYFNDTNTEIWEDGSGNLSFKDANAGTYTLAQLATQGDSIFSSVVVDTIFSSNLYMGGTGATGFTEIESDGTVQFSGAATVYKRIWMGWSNFNLVGTPPGVDTGDFGLRFDDTLDEWVAGCFILPPDYKEGSDVYVGVYWSPRTTNTGGVYWRIMHEWTDKGSVEPGWSTLNSVDAAPGTAWEVQELKFAAVSGTGHAIEGQFNFRCFRVGSSASDTFTGDTEFRGVFLDYEVDTIGKRTSTTK